MLSVNAVDDPATLSISDAMKYYGNNDFKTANDFTGNPNDSMIGGNTGPGPLVIGM